MMASSSLSDPLLALWLDHPEKAVTTALRPEKGKSTPVVWQRDFSADVKIAHNQLDSIQTLIGLTEKSNDLAPDRLRALLTKQTTTSSQAAAPTPPLPPPENELLALLQSPPETASFAWDIHYEWKQAAEELREFLQDVQRFVSYYAWIETKIEGKLVARTIVSWTGDFQTEWNFPIPSGIERLHARSLQLALASRTALLRTTTLILTGAILTLPLLVHPGNILLTLPAVWRFIQRLRQELAQTQQNDSASNTS